MAYAQAISAGFSVVSGIMGSRSKRKAAKRARREAARQADEILLQIGMMEERAAQEHLDMQEQLQEMESYNAAAAAYAGRTDRSLEAIRKAGREKYGKNIDRLRAGVDRERESIKREAEAVRRSGASAAAAYRSEARASLFDTALRAADYYRKT